MTPEIKKQIAAREYLILDFEDNLLQKLWDEHVWVSKEISDALNDKDPWSILNEILSDTEEMRKLRQYQIKKIQESIDALQAEIRKLEKEEEKKNV